MYRTACFSAGRTVPKRSCLGFLYSVSSNCLCHLLLPACLIRLGSCRLLTLPPRVMTLTPMARRYLSDPSHRETFESAHSVVLAIFASHAQQQQYSRHPHFDRSTNHGRQQGTRSKLLTEPEIQRYDRTLDKGSSTPDSTGFVTRMIPFYAQCLIEVGILYYHC